MQAIPFAFPRRQPEENQWISINPNPIFSSGGGDRGSPARAAARDAGGGPAQHHPLSIRGALAAAAAESNDRFGPDLHPLMRSRPAMDGGAGPGVGNLLRLSPPAAFPPLPLPRGARHADPLVSTLSGTGNFTRRSPPRQQVGARPSTGATKRPKADPCRRLSPW